MGLLSGLLGGGDKPKTPSMEMPEMPSPEEQLFQQRRAESMARQGMNQQPNFTAPRRLPQMLGMGGAGMAAGQMMGHPQQPKEQSPNLLSSMLVGGAPYVADKVGDTGTSILSGLLSPSIFKSLGNLF
jgi:hypothetical protein